MIDIPRAKTELFGTDDTPYYWFTLLIPGLGIMGGSWLYSMNYIGDRLSQSEFLTLYFGAIFIVAFSAGLVTTYKKWGVITGVITGSAFCIGGMWLFWDYTITPLENVLMMIVLGSLVGVFFGSFGAVIGYTGRKFSCSSADDTGRVG